LAYFGSIIVACVVLGVVAGMVMGGLRGAVGAGFGAPGFTLSGDGVRQASAESQATISLPGGGSIDVGELEKFADALSQGAAGAAGAAAAGAATAPGVAATDPASLEGMLPATLPGGFTRESVSSGSAMGATQAEATYTRGESSITLSIMHLGPMGGIGALAGAVNVQENRQDADGYSRTSTTDGRVYNESVSRSSNSASYGVMGKGVALSADGYGVTIEEVRAAADAIGIARLEQSAPR